MVKSPARWKCHGDGKILPERYGFMSSDADDHEIRIGGRGSYTSGTTMTVTMFPHLRFLSTKICSGLQFFVMKLSLRSNHLSTREQIMTVYDTTLIIRQLSI